ncbi:hypothetical protein E2542_SST25946 [Spatholobus suberectus]|nr:hypothetical protein E2542_SST25946 [Spatholobus suberectus]
MKIERKWLGFVTLVGCVSILDKTQWYTFSLSFSLSLFEFTNMPRHGNNGSGVWKSGLGVTRRIEENCRGAGFHSPGRVRKKRTEVVPFRGSRKRTRVKRGKGKGMA